MNPRREPAEERGPRQREDQAPARPACPVCGGSLVEQRAKLICSKCRTICETCCEGGQG